MKTWNLTQKTETSPGNDLSTQKAYGKLNVTQPDGSTAIETVQGTIIDMVSEIEALRVRIDAALQVIKGELDDSSLGVDYFGIIFSNTPISMKLQEINRVISAVEGVRDVEYKSGYFDKITKSLHFYFRIRSAYGDIDYDKLFVLE